MFRLWIFWVMVCAIAVQSHKAWTQDAYELFEPADTAAYTLTPAVESLYQRTKTAIRHNDRQGYWHLQKQWPENHPLLPYLQRYYTLQFMDDLPASVIESFLLAHADTDFIKNLQFRYVAYLSTRDRTRFRQWYQQTPSHWLNANIHCHYLRQFKSDSSVIKANDDLINKLWQVPQSQIKKCDPVFSAWKRQGLLTEQRIMSRIKLVAKRGNSRLIVYLTSLLPSAKQDIGKLWGQVATTSGYVKRVERWAHIDAIELAQIVHYGLSRLIWDDSALAISIYTDLPAFVKLTNAQRRDLAHTFAIRLALAQDDNAGYWLARANGLGYADDLRNWTITHLLRTQAWQALYDYIDTLPQRHRDIRAQYWMARAGDELGKDVQLLWQALAEQRHYYGFQAAKSQGQAIQLNSASPHVSAKAYAEMANNPQFRKALLLWQVGERHWAYRAWVQLLRGLSDEDGRVAGVMAHNKGWHERAIFAMAEFAALDAVAVRFPMPFTEDFATMATQYDVNTTWLYAIARRESAFDPQARSRANARGLMQILPSTAEYLLARKVNKTSLYEPKRSIALGAQYLDYLKKKLSAHPILRTAAYNAGWSRVDDWLPLQPMPLDMWIETIPFKETRDYVRAVVAYEQIYALQLGEKSMFDQPLQMLAVSMEDLSVSAQRLSQR